MRCSATTGVIIYCNPDQTFVIHRAHHDWFDEYNCRHSVEDTHTPVHLLLQQYLESLIHHSDLLNLIPYKLDITYTSFSDTKTITYEI